MFENLKKFMGVRSKRKVINLKSLTVKNNGIIPDGYIFCVKEWRGIDQIYFIIDTGASCTIFDKCIMIRNYSRQPGDFTSADGNGVLLASGGKMDMEKFEFEFLNVKRNFFATDFSFLSNHSGYSIGGLIGTDLLKEVNAKLDLTAQTLTFKNQ